MNKVSSSFFENVFTGYWFSEYVLSNFVHTSKIYSDHLDPGFGDPCHFEGSSWDRQMNFTTNVDFLKPHKIWGGELLFSKGETF